MGNLPTREIVISKGWETHERHELVQRTEQSIAELPPDIQADANTALEGILRFVSSDGVDSESLERQRREIAHLLEQHVRIIIVASRLPLYRRPL